MKTLSAIVLSTIHIKFDELILFFRDEQYRENDGHFFLGKTSIVADRSENELIDFVGSLLVVSNGLVFSPVAKRTVLFSISVHFNRKQTKRSSNFIECPCLLYTDTFPTKNGIILGIRIA